MDPDAQAELFRQLEPKPVDAEEDTGSMAQFMLDASQKVEPRGEDGKAEMMDTDEAQTGADFAAELAQKYEAQQKDREAGSGIAEKIAQSGTWFQNGSTPPAQSDGAPDDRQATQTDVATEANALDD